MKNTESGEEAQRKANSARMHKSDSDTGCPFCWFFIAIYPTLDGMTQQDEAVFTAHLKKSHGLSGEIQQ
jgi:hypothetical protein